MNIMTMHDECDVSVDISVVIPSFNHARFIVDAIESVVHQTFKNWEIVLVDDGSSDNTREILEQRYRDNTQIRLVFQSNHGAHHAINHGISLAKGQFIAILNSDDLYHPSRLQTLLDHCKTNVCALAFTPVTPIDVAGADIVAAGHPWRQLYANLMRLCRERGVREALLTGNMAVTSSNFFISTALIKRLGGFRNMRYNHDWDLLARILLRGLDIHCVGSESLLSYRIHGGNTITQNTLIARLELKRIFQSLVPREDPFISKLVQQMQTNMRSIRHEHQARVVQRVRQGYDLHIQSMLDDLKVQHQANLNDLQAQHQASLNDLQVQFLAQIDALNQTRNELLLQITSQEAHLAQILSSRSYRFSRLISRSFARLKGLFGLVK